MSNEDFVTNPERPLDFAGAKRLHSQWLRAVARDFQLDPKRLVLGSVLSSIIGDDINCFGYLDLPPNLAESRVELSAVLEWEISTPELPRQFVLHLKQVRDRLFDHAWNTQQDLLDAQELWKREVKDYTEEYLDRSSSCGKAERYFARHSEMLHKPFMEYRVREGYLIPYKPSQN